MDIFTGIITSKTRIRVLLRLFLNPNQKAYLRELADEFDISPSQVKSELNQLERANLLSSKKSGRQLLFQANAAHPIFNELHSMVKKALGMDKIIESIITRLGNLDQAILIDDYAEGKDNGIIDLILVGDIDHENLRDLTQKTERYIERKIRTLVLTKEEHKKLRPSLENRPQFILWDKDYSEENESN